MANRRWKDSFKFLRSSKNLEKDYVKWLSRNNSLSPNHPQSLQHDWRFSEKYQEPETLQFKALLQSSYPKFGSLWYAEPQRLRQMDNSVKNILKLAKSMNHGNYDIVLKRRSALIQLVEEFHKQYQSLHFFNKDIKEKGKQDVTEEDNASSFSNSDSEESDMFYTPEMSTLNSGHSFDRDNVASKAGSPLTEDTREVVKEAFYVEPVSVSSNVEKVDVDGIISESNLFREELDEKENEVLYLTKGHHVHEIETSEKIKELDRQVDTLGSQLEILNLQNQSLKDINKIKDNEARRLCEENLILKDRISELELIIEEKGDEIFAVLKNFNDNEKLLMDSLSFQEGKLDLLLSQTSKGSDEILGLQQELENKSHEMSEFLKLEDSLKEELDCKTAQEQDMAEEMNSLRIQIQDLEMQLNSLAEPKGINNEVKQLISQNEKLYHKIFLVEAELKEKEEELENKVGEMEKIVIENEECVQVLKEEKREAIRQLCVWQDYHFNRYDLLKKAFYELIARNQVRAS